MEKHEVNMGYPGFIPEYKAVLVGRDVVQQNGHLLVVRDYIQGEHRQLTEEVIQGYTGVESVVSRHNIAPEGMPPRWVIPAEVQENDREKVLFVRGHLPNNGEKIIGKTGHETVLHMRKINTPDGPSYALAGRPMSYTDARPR